MCKVEDTWKGVRQCVVYPHYTCKVEDTCKAWSLDLGGSVHISFTPFQPGQYFYPHNFFMCGYFIGEVYTIQAAFILVTSIGDV